MLMFKVIHVDVQSLAMLRKTQLSLLGYGDVKGTVCQMRSREHALCVTSLLRLGFLSQWHKIVIVIVFFRLQVLFLGGLRRFTKAQSVHTRSPHSMYFSWCCLGYVMSEDLHFCR